MTINSRDKGAKGERELANYLKDKGYPEARRGQQFSGSSDSPDVVCPGLSEEFHFEVKRVERTEIWEWFAQAQRDAGKKVPLVVHRKSRKDWIVVMTLDDFLNMQLGRPLP
jgi:Holliday junction resolvase